jgi:hypothetical protein
MAMPEMEAVKDAALKYDKPTLARLAQSGQLSPTLAVMAGMMRDRIVQSEMKPPSPPTVAEEVMQPMGQRMGLAAAAQAPQQPQPQGQGLDQVPVPQQMFERQGMANGGIVAFQAGGQPSSFAGMYSGLDTDLTGGTSESFAANLKGALPAIQGYGTDLATQRKEDRDFGLPLNVLRRAKSLKVSWAPVRKRPNLHPLKRLQRCRQIKKQI